MERKGYSKYIEQMLAKERLGAIIMPRTMAKKLAKKFALPLDKAISICNLNFKRLADRGILVRVKKGIYCCKVETVFGGIKPDLEQLAEQMLSLKDGKVIGYNTGAEAINKLGLSTQIPKYIDIVSNNYRAKLPKGGLVRVHKPVMKINNKNWKYLKFLDIFDTMNQFPLDATDPEVIFRDYIKFNKLDILTLVRIAGKYYSQKAILRLVKFLSV